MPKVAKKSVKNLKSKASKRNDIVLAIVLGTVITAVGIFVVRYSSASNASFRRNPVTQMTGGKVVRKTLNTLVRVASSPSPGVDQVSTPVSAAEMANTLKVCAEYTTLKPNTRISLEYWSKTSGVAVSLGTTVAKAGKGQTAECVITGGQAFDGTIKVNVIPGSAEINKLYGVYREADD